MGTYLKNWMPIKRNSDLRLITVDTIWSLTGKDLEFKGIAKSTDLKTIIVEYNVIDGTKNESYPIKEGVYLHMNWNDSSFPADHKITVRAYVGATVVDEESVDTKDAPAY